MGSSGVNIDVDIAAAVVPVKLLSNLRILLIIMAVLLWCHWLWSRRHFYKFALRFPGYAGLPLLGSMLKVGHVYNFGPFCTQVFQELKTHTVLLWLSIHPLLLTKDQNLMDKILNSSETMNKADILYSPMNKVIGESILTSRGAKWHRNRKLIAPTIGHKMTVSFSPVFHKARNLAIRKLSKMTDGREYEFEEFIKCVLLGVTVETIMGKKMNEDDQVNEELTGFYTYVIGRMPEYIQLDIAKLGSVLELLPRYKRAKTKMLNFVLEVIKNKLELHKQNQSNESNPSAGTNDDKEFGRKSAPILMDHAINLYKQNIFTFDDIVGESNVLVIGSFETTASAIVSTLVLLAMHPEVQEQLFEEIHNIFPEKEFTFEYEQIDKMPLFDRVINEALRLAPPIPNMARETAKEVKLDDGTVLPKGLIIYMSIYHMNRCEDLWGPDANKFNPDRFLKENFTEQQKRAFIPFSKGIRNCPGGRYAQFSMKIMLSGLLRNYKFSTSTKFQDFKIIPYVTLKYGFVPRLKIETRE